MKPQSLFGVTLIVAGVLILLYQGLTYTSRINPAITDKSEVLPIMSMVGVLCTGGGIFLMVLGSGSKGV